MNKITIHERITDAAWSPNGQLFVYATDKGKVVQFSEGKIWNFQKKNLKIDKKIFVTIAKLYNFPDEFMRMSKF